MKRGNNPPTDKRTGLRSTIDLKPILKWIKRFLKKKR